MSDGGRKWNGNFDREFIESILARLEVLERQNGNTTFLLGGGKRATMQVSKENAVVDLTTGGTLIWQANLDGEIVEYRLMGSLA